MRREREHDNIDTIRNLSGSELDSVGVAVDLLRVNHDGLTGRKKLDERARDGHLVHVASRVRTRAGDEGRGRDG